MNNEKTGVRSRDKLFFLVNFCTGGLLCDQNWYSWATKTFMKPPTVRPPAAQRPATDLLYGSF